MRPLVCWLQDHLGLAAIGILGLAAVAVAVILVASGGSSGGGDSGGPRASRSVKVAAGPPPSPAKPKAKAKADRGGEARAADGSSGSKVRRHRVVAAHHRSSRQSGAPADTSSPSPSASQAEHAKPAVSPPAPAPKHAVDQATAERVAAAHPGLECPKSYSREECEGVVEAAADPTPSTPVTTPADCGEAMSRTQCEEVFAEEEQARANGTASIDAKECIADPQLPACAAALAQMELEYEAAHPGG
jgi:hypothetical protein